MKLLLAARPDLLARRAARDVRGVDVRPPSRRRRHDPPRRPNARRPARRPVKVDQARAESLYVSTDPEDHPPRNFERDIAAKAGPTASTPPAAVASWSSAR